MVEKIYEIPVPRQAKARQKKFSKSIAHPGETRTYFSSMCVCDLGVNAATTCKDKTCGICNAIRSSFGCLGFGAPYHMGRDPSSSDKFTYTVTTSPYRISVACTAIADRKREVPENAPIFVADADGIIPVYVIMFFK
ncbi:hypothetical protein PM082_022608 [Marasmius tenuissimus]|nr:hypothetical protein PM082_022608 [Marasmius tenuissimus]